MIQRIQSIYLLAALALAASVFFLPLLTKTDVNTGNIIYKLEVTRADVFVNGASVQSHPVYPLAGLNGAVTGILAIALFSFKNRKRQMKVCRMAMVIILVFISFIVIKSGRVDSGFPAGIKTFYQAGTYFPVIELILAWLAFNAIKKDDELVRSADRIR